MSFQRYANDIFHVPKVFQCMLFADRSSTLFLVHLSLLLRSTAIADYNVFILKRMKPYVEES